MATERWTSNYIGREFLKEKWLFNLQLLDRGAGECPKKSNEAAEGFIAQVWWRADEEGAGGIFRGYSGETLSLSTNSWGGGKAEILSRYTRRSLDWTLEKKKIHWKYCQEQEWAAQESCAVTIPGYI